MKKYLLVILLLFGCKTPCNSPASLPSKLSNVLITQWQCTNPAQVNSDLDNWFSNHNLCTKPANYTGLIADLVCPLAMDLIRIKFANAVPASWGCNPELIGLDAAYALSTFCSLIPF